MDELMGGLNLNIGLIRRKAMLSVNKNEKILLDLNIPLDIYHVSYSFTDNCPILGAYGHSLGTFLTVQTRYWLRERHGQDSLTTASTIPAFPCGYS